ncbi:MAG TPA: hypothetical protein PKH24_07190 [Sedimentisphaerales bacterium]|jgi:hypothetical protein|nr:hypothetical protein [Sedimentisphaerales bacterium]HNU31510.1 hypothetical protein [Sedimentisphaerales bacterium]
MRNLVAVAVSALIALWATAPAVAFDGHRVTEGPLILSVGELTDVTRVNQPYDVTVTLENAGAAPLEVDVHIDDLVDEWHVVGETSRHVQIESHTEIQVAFQIAASPGALSALYPVHVYASFQSGGQPVTAHAVRIFESNFEKPAASSTRPPELPVNILSARGALPLWSLRTHRVAWQFFDKPLAYMPVGWQGSSSESSAYLGFGSVARGTMKQAITMHPPWKPASGTVFAEYRVKLPDTTPLTLAFANAIRDNTAAEPPSDGVTFRVWVGEQKLFERHTDSKTWLDGATDLSAYRGQTVLLQLESHPGPKRDTTCDSSYWAEPVLIAGELPKPTPEAEKQQRRDAARSLVRTGEGEGTLLTLEDGYRVALLPGDAGLLDGTVAIGNRDACVVFDGLRISILGCPVGSSLSTVSLAGKTDWADDGHGLNVTQPLELAGETFDLTVRIRAEGSGLRIKVDCPKRITDFALGSADQKAPRVYYGHGYCIVEPEAFQAGFGGHNLSTSHVGFDFDEGLSLLVACDHPPDFLEVTPESRTYALHTHLDATMTLVPSTAGTFDCAKKYRPLYDKQTSPGFARKAGRFVFDIWGGRYADIARTMQEMIAYGLTDSLLTVHVWQRWGYDYRLPDIYPPLPSLGTVEDMQGIARVCAEHDIPWGLHDNYIDFYPDAQGYSYDEICFTEDGRPIPAWLNEGRDAQSYRWRPDCFLPWLKRNLGLIGPTLKPTHYFIDVFTSIDCFDYYDRAGRYHSMLETRQCWGEAFAWIRDTLGGNAPMTSEAGDDQLIGYLDGADCQHLQLSSEAKSFCITLACRDWERVPWYDAVLHDKFSLHGVGYSGRYQGGRSRQEHGIESDDYLSVEILEGHAMMIDAEAFGRGAVRKYWLAQDFIRSIATDRIAGVQFVDGDIHKQIITWESGATVCVNRGAGDWRVAGRTLPQYGYYAINGPIESSVEEIDGIVVERSGRPDRWYFNARGFGPEGQLAIRPQVASVEYLGNRAFKLITNWQAQEPAPKDLHVFIHFTSDQSNRSDGIAFQSGGSPSPATSQWAGTIRLGDNWVVQIPSQYGPGEYGIWVGLWDPTTGRRYGLLGEDDGTTRYRVGTLVVEGAAGTIGAIRLVAADAPAPATALWNIGRVAVDFGPAITEGAFRCERTPDALVVTPLPQLGPFSVALRPERLGWPAGARAQSIDGVNADGEAIRRVDFEQMSDLLRFTTRRDEFAYRIRFQ